MLRWLAPRLLGAKLPGESVEERKAAAEADSGAGIPKEQLQGLMQDRTSSHLMEVFLPIITWESAQVSPQCEAWALKNGMSGSEGTWASWTRDRKPCRG